MEQFATTLHDEIPSDPMQSMETKDEHTVPNNSNQAFFVLSGSDGDSDSEEIEILELKKRMWKDQMLLNKLEGTSNEVLKSVLQNYNIKEKEKEETREEKVASSPPLHPNRYGYTKSLNLYAELTSSSLLSPPLICISGASNRVRTDPAAVQSKQCTTTCHCSIVRQPRPSRKAELRAEDGVLHYMIKVMRDCNARGFVYGILPNTGPPITGSSDSLRAWWKDTVEFDRNAPSALVNLEAILPVIEENLVSYLYKLQDMNDNTIGSILSALIQHCEPPQRTFPLEQGLAPPWWPMGDEIWWGLQGQTHAHLGPPPYRKPHDLRKGWKVSLLAAVIKHMSPRFDYMRSLVWQSKRLQHKMSVKDVDTWSRVLKQEEALAEQTKRSLVITPLDDDGGKGSSSGDDGQYVSDGMIDDTRKRKWGFGNENCSEGNFIYGDLYPNVEFDPTLHRKLEGTTSKMAEDQIMQCTNTYQSYVRDGGCTSGDGGSGDSRSDGTDYAGDDNTGTRKLWRFENGEESIEEGLISGDLWPNLELDLHSINVLMRLPPEEFSNADLGSLI